MTVISILTDLIHSGKKEVRMMQAEGEKAVFEEDEDMIDEFDIDDAVLNY